MKRIGQVATILAMTAFAGTAAAREYFVGGPVPQVL